MQISMQEIIVDLDMYMTIDFMLFKISGNRRRVKMYVDFTSNVCGRNETNYISAIEDTNNYIIYSICVLEDEKLLNIKFCVYDILEKNNRVNIYKKIQKNFTVERM